MQGSASDWFYSKPLLYCWFGLLLYLPLLVLAETGLPLLKNYKPKEYNAGSQNWALLQDNRGLIYVGNNVGVLEFDGVHWRTIRTSNQSVVRSLALSQDGRIFVGAKAELGYLNPTATAQTQYHSWTDRIPAQHRNFQDIRQTFATKDGAVFVARQQIFLINDQQVQVLQSQSHFSRAFALADRILVQDQQEGLLELKNNRLVPLPGAELLAGKNIVLAEDWGDGILLFGCRDDGFYLLDQHGLKPWASELQLRLRQAVIYSSTLLSNQLLAIGTSRDGLYLLNRQGQLVQHLNKNSGLLDDNIRALYQDKQQGLWLALDHGLARVEVSAAISQYNDVFGLSGNVLSLIRHQTTTLRRHQSGVISPFNQWRRTAPISCYQRDFTTNLGFIKS